MAYDSKFAGTVINWKDATSSTGDRTISLNDDILSKFYNISINPSTLDPKQKPNNTTAYLSIEYISVIDNKNKVIQFNSWLDSITGWTGLQDEDFAKFMKSYIYSSAYTSGLILKYSPIDESFGDAIEVVDGNEDTYSTIGDNGVRYIMHDFGNNLDTAIPVQRIEWVVNSEIEKSYSIEAWNGEEWKILYIGKSYPGENLRKKLIWINPQNIYAIRIYHRGDYSTNNPNVEVNITSNDKGSGTVAYKISQYADFRDSQYMEGADDEGWIETTNGSTIINWDLISDISYWDEKWDSDEIINDMIVYLEKMFIACESGKIYCPSDNEFSSFVEIFDCSSEINTLYCTEDYIYAGCQNGKVYFSETGLSWSTLVTVDLPSLYEEQKGIISLCVFDNRLYIGTDCHQLYNCSVDSEDLSTYKEFSDRYVSSLFTNDDNLWISVAPSGKIFKYDGNSYSFIKNTNLTEWGGINKYTSDSNLYFYGNYGYIYRYKNSLVELLYDSAANKITDSVDACMVGPVITSSIEINSGNVPPGEYIYAISYVDYNDVESFIGNKYTVTLYSNTRGSIKLYWKKIDGAKYYNIYRTINSYQSEQFIRMLDSNITTVEEDEEGIDRICYTDNGTRSLSAKTKPSSTNSKIWFSTDNDILYIYDKNSIMSIDGPGYQYIDNIINYDSSIYISCRETDSAFSKVYKFIGELITPGTRRIYVKTKDALGNESDTVYDDIYFDTLYKNIILEIDEDNILINSYERNNKIISPQKEYCKYGSYISEPFYASTLSSWDVLRYMIYLPEDTEFEIYARTSETKDGLESEDWFGPGTEANDETNDYYYDYEGDGYYDGEYDIYPGQAISKTGDFDISTLNGKWIQFKAVLKTYADDVTPFVYSILLKYLSVNAVYFFTTLFDISDFASSEGIDDPNNITIKRGILSFNGSIPLGGDIQFGISTKESNNWQDYQIITPNKIFNMEDRANNFKIGIMLISTDEDISLVHEFGISFDIGDNFIHANKGLYDSPPYVLEEGS